MKENIALQQRLSDNIHSTATPDHSPALSSPINQTSAHSARSSPTNRFIQLRDGHEDENTGMINPLSSGPPTYITDTAGKPRELFPLSCTGDHLT
jgi:proline utilization trans-activator